MNSNWRIVAQPEIASLFTALYIIADRGQDTGILQPDGSLEKLDPGSRPEPTVRLPEDVLPHLFQALWDRGLRPKDRRYEVESELLRGQLEIQGKHLADMRVLAFQKAGESA